MDILGRWYESDGSYEQDVTLQLRESGLVDVLLEGSSKTLCTCWLAQLSFSRRLANTARFIDFPDGQKFETLDNHRIDTLLKQFNHKDNQRWLYIVENHRYCVAIALLVLVFSGLWLTHYGVPVAAKTIASTTPQPWVDRAGAKTLAFFDEQLMRPSQLEQTTQERVVMHFAPIISDHPQLNIRIVFRDGDIGANAFALPDGTIIFTDDMVLAANNDDELLAVMAHEVGHLHYHHSLRGVIQSSLVGFGFALLAGDISGAAEVFLGTPLLLTHLAYSREFEREADNYALNYMLENNIDPAHFSHLMRRISTIECAYADVGHIDKKCLQESSMLRYLSTHPELSERMKKFDSANAR